MIQTSKPADDPRTDGSNQPYYVLRPGSLVTKISVRRDSPQQMGNSHISNNSKASSDVYDPNHYAEILAELETVGLRISQAKQDLMQRRKERQSLADPNFDPQQERTRVQQRIDEQNRNIAELSKRRNYLLDVTRRNAEEIERQRITGDLSVSFMDLNNQVRLTREQLAHLDKDLNAYASYYRFVTSQIAHGNKHLGYPRFNEYGMPISEHPITPVEVDNALEELRAMKCMHQSLVEDYAKTRDRKHRLISQELIRIKQKEQMLKYLVTYHSQADER